MSILHSALKQEITRISRKEVRSLVSGARKASAQHRRHIAALRKQVAQLQRELAAMRKRAPASRPGREVSAGRKVRFSASGLKSHRERLGLSAADYGTLAGVTGQTVFKWEKGRGTPRPAQLQVLAELRRIGKREAAARMEASRGDATPKGRPRN
jgi:DNA-binding transcriptional regulator YiaG